MTLLEAAAAMPAETLPQALLRGACLARANFNFLANKIVSSPLF